MSILDQIAPWVPLVATVTTVLLNLCGLSRECEKHETDKDAVPLQKEGLKALGEWSQWLITLQTAFIGVIGLKIKTDPPFLPPAAVQGAIISFTISIVAATILLGTIPGAIRLLPIKDKKHKDCYDLYSKTIFKLPLRSIAGVEHVLFLVGLIHILLGLFFPQFFQQPTKST